MAEFWQSQIALVQRPIGHDHNQSKTAVTDPQVQVEAAKPSPFIKPPRHEDLLPKIEYVNILRDDGDPVEVLWQRPSGKVNAVLLMLHGCSHQGTDWWPKNSCSRCVGLPEELRISETALRRGHIPIAVTSQDRETGCWTPPDMLRIESAVQHVYKVEELAPETTPLYAFGASSGGAMVGRLAESYVIGRQFMKCRIPQIMRTTTTVSFSSKLQNGSAATWQAPPSLYIHMPRDRHTSRLVAANVKTLQQNGIIATEVHCKPLQIKDDFFSSRLSNISANTSKALVAAYKAEGLLDSNSYLSEEPRMSSWRIVVERTREKLEPGAMQDLLVADASPLSEVMNVAYASHEMCATFATEMLEFCENPVRTCAKYGWVCNKSTGGV